MLSYNIAAKRAFHTTRAIYTLISILCLTRANNRANRVTALLMALVYALPSASTWLNQNFDTRQRDLNNAP